MKNRRRAGRRSRQSLYADFGNGKSRIEFHTLRKLSLSCETACLALVRRSGVVLKSSIAVDSTFPPKLVTFWAIEEIRFMKITYCYRVASLAVAFLFTAATAFSISAAATKDKDVNNSTGESRFAKFDGARIHYVNYGKGSDALLLIHGWTQNADAWRDNVADFAKRNRVIVIELPGHGQSDNRKSLTRWTTSRRQLMQLCAMRR